LTRPGRTPQSGSLEVLGRIKVHHYARVVKINVGNSIRVGTNDNTGALVLGRCLKLGEQCTGEKHRMAPAPMVARNHDRLLRTPIFLYHPGEGRRSHQRMVRKMNDRTIRLGSYGLQGNLNRRKLATRVVVVRDHHDTGIIGDRPPHSVCTRTDNNDQPRDGIEHRLRERGKKTSPANLK
jgi:hypothetical protein